MLLVLHNLLGTPFACASPCQLHLVVSGGLIPLMLSSMLHCHIQIETGSYAAALCRYLASLWSVCVQISSAACHVTTVRTDLGAEGGRENHHPRLAKRLF